LPYSAHFDLLRENAQLLHGRRPLEVRRRHHHAAAIASEVRGELGAGGGLAGPLEAAHHDHRRRRVDEHDERALFAARPGGRRPHQLDEAVVDDADHLLAGPQAPGHLAAEGIGDHLFAERRDDVDVDVSLQQGRADVAHGLPDVVLSDPASAGEVAEGVAQALGKGLEHRAHIISAGISVSTSAIVPAARRATC
jgi:hypothetical protein